MTLLTVIEAVVFFRGSEQSRHVSIIALKSEGLQSFRLEERDKYELMCIIAQKGRKARGYISSDKNYMRNTMRYSGSVSRYSDVYIFVEEVTRGN